MHRRFMSFLMVGLFNTAVGVGVIAGGILLGLHPLIANALGFVVGLCVSFLLNSRFTFKSNSRNLSLVVRYLVAFLAAYGCNLVAVLVLDRMFPQQVLVTHVLGIIPYTIVFFLLADIYVFGERRISIRQASHR
jgi:Predicted membrane protein